MLHLVKWFENFKFICKIATEIVNWTYPLIISASRTNDDSLELGPLGRRRSIVRARSPTALALLDDPLSARTHLQNLDLIDQCRIVLCNYGQSVQNARLRLPWPWQASSWGRCSSWPRRESCAGREAGRAARPPKRTCPAESAIAVNFFIVIFSGSS